MAVVKGNGYGHGLTVAAQVFLDAGFRELGVADLNEAMTLRQVRPARCQGAARGVLLCVRWVWRTLMRHKRMRNLLGGGPARAWQLFNCVRVLHDPRAFHGVARKAWRCPSTSCSSRTT